MAKMTPEAERAVRLYQRLAMATDTKRVTVLRHRVLRWLESAPEPQRDLYYKAIAQWRRHHVAIGPGVRTKP